MNAPIFRHATALVIGEKAVLIEGPPGAGKSELADTLIAEAGARGLFARLVGDDRVGLSISGGRLIVSPHPAIAGLMERRGNGIAEIAHHPAAVVAGIVLLSPDPPRMPEPESGTLLVEGVRLPFLHLKSDKDLAGRRHLVFGWFRG